MWFDVISNYLDSSVIGLKFNAEQFCEFFVKIYLHIKSIFNLSTLNSFSYYSHIGFTELQITLLKVLSLILVTSLILTGVYWQKYGTIITDKFIRPSTLKEIEELKLSVAKLKLPKEHSPRI